MILSALVLSNISLDLEIFDNTSLYCNRQAKLKTFAGHLLDPVSVHAWGGVLGLGSLLVCLSVYLPLFERSRSCATIGLLMFS